MTPRVLIVAGSDSGGGAGIQADIRTVTMLGGHAMTAIAAITAQNTLGAQAIHAVPPEMVVAQMRSVIDDIGVDAVKIGMIGAAGTAEAVAAVLEELPGVPIVFDPVMVATSGAVLADAATIAAFERLMRIATLVTPNLPEAAALGGVEAIRAHGAAVLLKGGHDAGDVITDTLIAADGAAPVARWPARSPPGSRAGCRRRRRWRARGCSCGSRSTRRPASAPGTGRWGIIRCGSIAISAHRPPTRSPCRRPIMRQASLSTARSG